jgi:hypothetical protein
MYLVKHNMTALEHPKYSPHRSQSYFFIFLRLKSVLKEQRFVNVDEVDAKETKTLTEVSNNGVQEHFDKQNCVTARQN